MSSPKKPRKQYDLEYKRRIVQEYLQGGIKSADLAQREGIDRGEIYKWKADERLAGLRQKAVDGQVPAEIETYQELLVWSVT